MRTSGEILFCAALLVAGPVGYARTVDPPYEVGTWPGFRQAAVSYTFDDGCSNQFAVALPMFNAYGFKMTLFTVTGWSPDWTVLQAAAAQGHEVASHTVTHPSLSGMTLANQTTELRDSRDAIESHIPERPCLTLAYPYCVPSNLALTMQYYIAARHCQGSVEPSTPRDFYQISSIICGSAGAVKTAGDFSARFLSTASSRGWCVFLIHGIDNDGGYSPLSSTVLQAGLEYLSARKSTLWVATFADGVRYIRERDAVSVQESSNQGASITLQVTDPLDDVIYNLPVTLRRPLPAGWSGARVSQNGRTAAATLVTVDSLTCMMFDAVPDAGDVVLSKCPAPPVGLTASAGNATVALDWSDSNESDWAGYYVYRSTTSGGDYRRLTGSLLTDSSYEDVNVPHDKSYYYVVTAVDPNGTESGYSNEVRGGLYGDWTGNGAVEPDDLPFFFDRWLVHDCHEAAGVDLNEDCAVNLHEFAVLAKNWLQNRTVKSSGPAGTTEQPSPGGRTR
jgi:hypothetical protein